MFLSVHVAAMVVQGRLTMSGLQVLSNNKPWMDMLEEEPSFCRASTKAVVD